MAPLNLPRFGNGRDLWSDLHEFQRRMNRLFEDTYASSPEFPLVNVWASEEDYVLTAELPGVTPEDLNISVHGKLVTLQGTRKRGESSDGQSYHRQERGYGDFSRSLELPYEIDPDGVEAKLEHGVLQVRLPRSEKDKPRKIQVQSA